jgi:predicted porin
VFQYEIDPNVAQTSSKTAGTSATGTTSNITTSAGNGQSFLGLTGGFGSIKFGTPNLATLSANGDGNLGFGTAIGSGYRVSSFDAVRLQSSLRLDTAVFSGFSASYVYVPKNDKQSGGSSTGNAVNQINGRDGASEIGVAYANGPLSVRYADLTTTQDAGYYNNSTSTVTRPTGADFNLKTLSAKYAVNNVLSVAFFNQRITSETLKVGSTTAAATDAVYDRKTNGIAATYAITPVLTAMVNYQKVKNGAAASGTGTANKDTTVTGLGLDYAMSKRTTAYVRYEKNDDQADIRTTTGYTDVTGNAAKYNAAAVGIRHTF